MSLFTCIKTKIKERPYLIEALELMGHDIEEKLGTVVKVQHKPEYYAQKQTTQEDVSLQHYQDKD